MYDLNKLIPPGSDMRLTTPLNINDRGEIATLGIFDNSYFHAVLLIPKKK
jgi:hypothetical protein